MEGEQLQANLHYRPISSNRGRPEKTGKCRVSVSRRGSPRSRVPPHPPPPRQAATLQKGFTMHFSPSFSSFSGSRHAPLHKKTHPQITPRLSPAPLRQLLAFVDEGRGIADAGGERALVLFFIFMSSPLPHRALTEPRGCKRRAIYFILFVFFCPSRSGWRSSGGEVGDQ